MILTVTIDKIMPLHHCLSVGAETHRSDMGFCDGEWGGGVKSPPTKEGVRTSISDLKCSKSMQNRTEERKMGGRWVIVPPMTRLFMERL